MIRVAVERSQDCIVGITVRGHAQSGPHGQDLVCAGVSSIVIGALNALDEQFDEDCFQEMGNNRIRIQVLNSSQGLQHCLAMLVTQLKTMENSFPKFIQIAQKEV